MKETKEELVHCLKCDAVYIEKEIQIEICPHCGNEDKEKTVYLVPDNFDI